MAGQGVPKTWSTARADCEEFCLPVAECWWLFAQQCLARALRPGGGGGEMPWPRNPTTAMRARPGELLACRTRRCDGTACIFHNDRKITCRSHARGKGLCAVQAVEMLRGDRPLPWEGELSAQHAQRLGALKQPVLQLLQRDPALRPSMHDFQAACAQLFASPSAVRV